MRVKPTFFAAVLASALVAPAAVSATPPPAAVTVPVAIPADCSRPVDADLNLFFASLPDGSTVRLAENGCYAHTRSIRLVDKTNITIDGNGSTFRSSASNDGRVSNPSWLLLRGRNVTLANLTIVGNFNLTGPRSPGRVCEIAVERPSTCNQFNGGVAIYGGDGIHVTDVSARNVFGDGLVTAISEYADSNPPFETPRNVRVARFHAAGTARHCFAPSQVTGFWLEDSTGTDCWYGGIDIENETTFPTRDVHILRSTFDHYFMFGIAVPIAGDTGDIEIRGNRFLTTPDNVCNQVITVGSYPSLPNTFSNVVTEDNQLRASGVAIQYDHVVGGSIRNNSIERVGKGGYTPVGLCGPTQPVVVTNSSGVVVAKNALGAPGATPPVTTPSGPTQPARAATVPPEAVSDRPAYDPTSARRRAADARRRAAAARLRAGSNPPSVPVLRPMPR